MPRQSCTKVPKQQCSKVPKQECTQGKSLIIPHLLISSSPQCLASSAATSPRSPARTCQNKTARLSTSAQSANNQPTADLILTLIQNTKILQTRAEQLRACLAHVLVAALFTNNVLFIVFIFFQNSTENKDTFSHLPPDLCLRVKSVG